MASKSKKTFIFRSLATGLGLLTVPKTIASEVFRKYRWVAPSQASGEPPAFRLDPLIGSRILRAISTPKFTQPLGERVVKAKQVFGSAVIRGSWTQSVYDARGNKIYESGAQAKTPPKELLRKIEDLYRQKDEVLEALRFANADFRHASTTYEPQLELNIDAQNGYALEWTIDWISEDETRAQRAFLNHALQLIGIKDIGHTHSQAIGDVYRKGPKSSPIETVSLDSLDGSGRLSSQSVEVKTAKSTEALSPENDFRFGPNDERFEQVQAFFHADQVLRYFESTFNAKPMTQIELKVQVGDHSNSAYYYSNKIRLGSGDGVRFHRLAQDPSIVMHEVGHAIVDTYAGLPNDGEGGSLNEAFADYFAAAMLENPHMGESAYLAGPFVRTLENNYTAGNDLGTDLYRSSLVISGTLWDIRLALGPKIGDAIAFATLCRLGMGAHFKDFIPSLAAAIPSTLEASHRAKISEILNARAWPKLQSANTENRL